MLVVLLAGASGACALWAGLDKFEEVDCSGDYCDASVLPEAGMDAGADAPRDASSDVLAERVGPPIDAATRPPLTQVWPRWRVPTPGDGGTAAYDAGTDVVVDGVTGLLWQRTAVGDKNHEEAIRECAALGEGWRLPTRMELVSIVDFTRFSPAMNAVFHGPYGATWSSSPIFDDPSFSFWYVDFTDGRTRNDARRPVDKLLVRCVRRSP